MKVTIETSENLYVVSKNNAGLWQISLTGNHPQCFISLDANVALTRVVQFIEELDKILIR